MEKIKLLNTNVNGYFQNNQIDISDSIPTEGNHVVGDIIIKETQVEHMAIGWICLESGNPGIWSEFGGMFNEPIVLDPGTVGMNELNSEVKTKLLLGDSTAINVQALQRAIANCASKEDLENIDLSLYATKNEVQEFDDYAYAQIIGLRNDIGNTTNLQTKDKDLVSAINEVFQSGVNVKQNLVDALIAKNIDCSTSNTFDELINKISEIRYSPFVDWAKANTWLVTGTCTAMPATSYLLTAQAYKNKIYCIGGVGTTTANRAYNVKTNTWETLANMTTGRYGLDSTIIGDKIYCIGGYDNLTTNQVYDITNNKWSTLANMTTGREYLTVDAVGTNIYAIGGSGSSTYLNTNECYDTITNTWSTKTNMTVAKYGHASGVIGTDVYCIGGYTGSYVRTNYCYDTITNTWTTKTQLTAVRSDGDCVEANGKLYFIFGRSASTTYQRNNYCYDPVTNAWTTMTASTGVTSYGRALAYSNGMIFAFGGYNGSALSAVECYII